MTLIKRSETDYFRLAKICEIIVLPMNSEGAAGAGLTLHARNTIPGWYENIRQCCDKGFLEIGKPHLFTTKKGKLIISLPTKRYWSDASEIKDIKSCLEALRTCLKDYPLCNIATTFIGTGCSGPDQKDVEPLMYEYLDGMSNVVHLSMRPDAFDKPLKYLAIIGSRKYNDELRVRLAVTDALVDWRLDVSEFSGIVSGGADGVDKIAAGTGMEGDTTKSIASTFHIKPVVIRANWDKYGKSAGMIRNVVVADIATHVIALPSKTKSVGTWNMISLIEDHNKKNPDNKKLLKIFLV